MEGASRGEEPSHRQQVELVVLPQPSAGTAGEDTDTRVTEGEPLTASSRKLCVTEALVQKCGLTLGCERCHWGNAVKKSHDAACRQRVASPLRQPREVQEKPEERVRTCESVVGCGRHGNAEVPGQLEEWKCACWMTIATNGSQMLEDQQQ